jgi:hypothetical protein
MRVPATKTRHRSTGFGTSSATSIPGTICAELHLCNNARTFRSSLEFARARTRRRLSLIFFVETSGGRNQKQLEVVRSGRIFMGISTVKTTPAALDVSRLLSGAGPSRSRPLCAVPTCPKAKSFVGRICRQHEAYSNKSKRASLTRGKYQQRRTSQARTSAERILLKQIFTCVQPSPESTHVLEREFVGERLAARPMLGHISSERIYRVA